MTDNGKRRIDLAAWALVLITLLSVAFNFWGRFNRLEVRMDESDQDRHAMMDTMNRIEQRVIDLGEAVAGGDPKVKR